MWQKVGNIVIRNRLFILAVILLLTVFFGYFAVTNLKIDNKYGNTLPKNVEVQKQYLKFKAEFGEDGSRLVLAINNKNLYTEQNFRKWKELGDSILKMNGVLSVISEATLFTITDNQVEEKFEAKKIFSDPTYKEKSIDSIKRELRRNPLYNHLLYDDSTHVSLMMVGFDESYLEDAQKNKVVLQVEHLASSYEPYFGEVHFAGLPHIRIVIGKRISNEMILFLGLCLVASCVLIYYFFRSFKIIFVCVTVIAGSVIWALGTIGLFDFRLSIMMALIPPLMIVIGVPNSIFFYTSFHQEYRKSHNKIRATSSMIKNIGGARFLTNLTTAIGFCTFASSEKLMEFGIVASLNIMVVFVLSLCIIPIAITFSKDPQEKHLKHLDRKSSTKLLEGVIYMVKNHRKKIYVSVAIVCVVFLLGALKIKATGNITSDLPKNDPIVKDIRFVERSFGGSIPFEVLVNYKTRGRLFKEETMEKVQSVQELLAKDTLFSRSLSYVDFIKMINMAMHGNNPDAYRIISNRDKLRLKRYMDKFDITSANSASFSLKQLVDTANTVIRIRSQMKDKSSYEVREFVKALHEEIDSIMNPNRKSIEAYYDKIKKGDKKYIDSLFMNYTSIYNAMTYQISNGNENLQYELDMDPTKMQDFYNKPNFTKKLRKAIDSEYYGVVLTGTSVVAAEGTKYLFQNMLESVAFAIIAISALMAMLFFSIKMTVISMVPNIIPLILIAGFMGFLGIALKPSTLLVFGIALGITVDNAILFLAKYRQELRRNKLEIRDAVFVAIRETGLGIIYTSAVLFFGFLIFTFSRFGGTKAMGMLVSLAILFGTIFNILLLPSMLLSLEKFIKKDSYQQTYLDALEADEEDEEEENLLGNNSTDSSKKEEDSTEKTE